MATTWLGLALDATASIHPHVPPCDQQSEEGERKEEREEERERGETEQASEASG